MYCGLSTASEVFPILTTQLYQYLSVFLLFALFSDEPEVFLRKYSQTAILHAAHFPRVVNQSSGDVKASCHQVLRKGCDNNIGTQLISFDN